MPRGFSEKEMKRIRQALLNIGMERLKTTGVHKTTVEDLTSAVGISKGAFYKFFPSKEVLFFNVIEIYEQRLEEKFFKLFPEPAGEDIDINLISVIKTVVFSQEMQDYIMIMKRDDIEYLLYVIDPEIAEAHMGKDIAVMRAAIARLSEYGVMVKAEPEKVLAYISGLFCLFFEQHIFRENYFITVVETYIEMMIRVLLG